MEKIPVTLIAIVLGAIIGFSLTFVFKIIPEKWLQNYGYDPNSPKFRPAKRMKIFPHGIFAMIFCAACYGCAAFFSHKFLFATLRPLHIILIFLAVPIVTIVIMSDRLNRIIPDECSIALLVLGVLGCVMEFIEDSPWFSAEAPTYYAVLNRIIGMVVGFGFLWLIEFICETFLGKEGMGQGDMKLLGASGLLVGCYGLIVLIYVTAFTSVFFAIPLLIKKRIRIYNEEREIKASKDPIAARRALNKKKAQIHFSEDPDYIAFGPFLAIGAIAFLIFEPLSFKILIDFIYTVGWYF